MNNKILSLLAMVTLFNCSTSSDAVISSDAVVSADENGELSQQLSTGVAVGSTLRTTSGLNLRTGPGLGYSIRLVIPSGATVKTVNRTNASGGFYNVSYNGVVGYAYGAYLNLVSQPVVTPPNQPPVSTSVRDGAINRARGGVGFSYYWGAGRWIPFGVTSSNKGVCTGNCPSCTHSGANYGADCSGYVAKIWGVPSSNTNMEVNSHPYSTVDFKAANSQWSTVARGAVIKGDALVHNDNGSGHIFLYESGDGWGSMWSYEARGCSYGIQHNLRTAGSTYKAIKRAGY
jgi:cell wall-associated NlpC family hydrolase